MSSQNIDPDCLRAVLSRLPLAELITNVSLQLVSRQFSECQRLGLKTRATRSPVCLQINRQNYDPSNANKRLLSIGGVAVSTSELVPFKTSYLLDFVSEICFEERWDHTLPEDLAVQLQDVMERLRAVDKLTLKLVPSGYQERYRRIKDQKGPQFHAFKALLTTDLSFLTALASLELHSCVASPAFYADISEDFLQLLCLASNLSALALPTKLFLIVLNSACGASLLLRLAKLDLREVCDADDEHTEISCQPIVNAVAENCNNLADFRYDCSAFGSGYTGGKHVCIQDFTVFQRLTNLRCLYLHLAAQPYRRRSAATSDEISVLPLPTLESLTVVGQPFYSAEQTLALLDMAPNAKHLHLTDSDANNSFIADSSSAFCESLRDRLLAKRLPKLETLRLDVFNDRRGSLRCLDHIATIEAPIALRSVRIEEIYRDPYEVHHSRDRLDSIVAAITQAIHITHLRTRFVWQDGYLVLERLLRAMQHGSVQLLTLDVR